MTKIKICGIKSFKDVEYVNAALPDFVGFVFAKSKRHVDFNKAYLLKSELDKSIKTVGVFVNEDIDFVSKCCERGIIDMVQLHGDEDEKYIKKLKKIVYKPIIKAIRVEASNTLGIELFEKLQKKNRNGTSKKIFTNTSNSELIQYPLFDTLIKEAYGGTGRTFSWEIIKDYKKPFFLAGGLNFDNVVDAINLTNPFCVDISSGVETNGIKDRQKIIDIVNLVKSMNQSEICDNKIENESVVIKKVEVKV